MVNFAKRMDGMKASDIRELLKLTTRPEIISFAGGLPAPRRIKSAFPTYRSPQGDCGIFLFDRIFPDSVFAPLFAPFFRGNTLPQCACLRAGTFFI